MIVHIGYPKTGTTYLQKKVFPYFKGVPYADYNRSEMLYKYLFKYDIYSQVTKSFIIGDYKLFSYEGLVGKMGTGRGWESIMTGLYDIGVKKIIISIRRKDKMIRSLYNQYIYHGGRLSFKGYLRSKYFDPQFLNFEEKINAYKTLFGADNVLVIDIDKPYIDKLSKFIGGRFMGILDDQKVNVSLSKPSLFLLRAGNFVWRSYYHKPWWAPKWFNAGKARGVLEIVEGKHNR